MVRPFWKFKLSVSKTALLLFSCQLLQLSCSYHGTGILSPVPRFLCCLWIIYSTLAGIMPSWCFINSICLSLCSLSSPTRCLEVGAVNLQKTRRWSCCLQSHLVNSFKVVLQCTVSQTITCIGVTWKSCDFLELSDLSCGGQSEILHPDYFPGEAETLDCGYHFKKQDPWTHCFLFVTFLSSKFRPAFKAYTWRWLSYSYIISRFINDFLCTSPCLP